MKVHVTPMPERGIAIPPPCAAVVSKKLLSLTLLLLFMSVAITRLTAQTQFTCSTEDVQQGQGLGAPPPGDNCKNTFGNVSQFSDYVPTPQTPIKTVNLNFIVMQRQAPFLPDNFQNTQQDIDYLNAVLNFLNEIFSHSHYMACDGCYQETPFVEDSRIRFRLAGPIQFIADNQGFTNNGNTCGSYCYDNFGVCKDNSLNVFFCQNTANGGNGCGPGNYVMMYNSYSSYYNNGSNFWDVGQLLAHEIGHCMGLGHAWQTSEINFFGDLCQSAGINQAVWCGPLGNCDPGETPCPFNPYGFNSCPDPNNHCTNNIMVSSSSLRYISPMQMAFMHKKLIYGTQAKFLEVQKNTNAYTLTSDETWDIGRVVDRDIIVPNPWTLTIECKTIFSNQAHIIVQQGARLIVKDGGYLTTRSKPAFTCGSSSVYDRWGGIEVRGFPNVQQDPALFNESVALTANDPGVVNLDPGAIIENAYVAIAADGQYGGMVQANHVLFKNCRKVANILEYPYPKYNYSSFTDCKITQNESTSPNLEGVTMYKVNGVTFLRDTFELMQHGIVGGWTSSAVSRCYFKKNKIAITAGSPSPLNGLYFTIGGPTETDGNKFELNDVGVQGLSFQGLRVLHNDFIDHSTSGVQVEGLSHYEIMNNDFNNVAGGSYPVAEVSLFNTGPTEFNPVSCNGFNRGGGQSYEGIFCGGNNISMRFDGNWFSCFRDVRNDRTPDGDVGILGQQGNSLLAAANKFTHTAQADIFTPAIVQPPFTQSFNYFYPNAEVYPTSSFIPRCPRLPLSQACTNGNTYNFVNAQGTTWKVNCENYTLPITPPTGAPPGEPCVTRACLTNYYTTLANMTTLLQNGASNQLHTAILTDPSSKTTVNLLLAANPYLSDGVLSDVITSAGMPVSYKMQVLVPNAPLSEALMAQAQANLPATEYNSLAQAGQQKQFSDRQTLEQNYGETELTKNLALRYQVDQSVAVTDWQDALNLLNADPSIFARQKRIGLKFQMGDLNGVGTELTNYPINNTDDQEFVTLQHLALNLSIYGPGYQPSTNAMQILQQLSEAYSPNSGYAKILYWYFTEVLDYRPIPEPSAAGRGKAAEDLTAQPEQHSLTIAPNPATDMIHIYLPAGVSLSDTGAKVMLTDISGKTFRSDQLYSADISTIGLPAGLYIVTVRTADGRLMQGKFVKIH